MVAKQPKWLLGYKNDIYSQCGEDGVIEKILDIIPDKNKWCVEFGAWDGIFLSNVRSLIESSNYSAVLIEGSEERFQTLKNNYSKYNNVYPLNGFVGYSEKDNLDTILKTIEIPKDFDFLSIDVDGNDYHIWDAMKKYSPKVVCIEFNPTVPTEVEFVQEANPRVNQGSSLLSLVKLGKEKGYELVSVLPWNAFFVKSEYFPLYEISENSPQQLRKSTELVTHIFSGYDGKIILQGGQKLCWHGVSFNDKNLQILPKFLRTAPFNYGRVRKLLLYVLKKMKVFSL